MNLLYLTDVFCPWCYGFAPVMRRLAAEHPELPVRVLGGNLMDEPQTLTGMLEEYPTIREFFARLQETTGQSTEHFRQALEQAVAGTGPDLLMHSPAMNLPLAALRHLAPGHELEQMEAFQMAFYAQGRDVMAAGEQAAIAAAWLPAGTPAEALTAAMADPGHPGAPPGMTPPKPRRSWANSSFIRPCIWSTTASAPCWPRLQRLRQRPGQAGRCPCAVSAKAPSPRARPAVWTANAVFRAMMLR